MMFAPTDPMADDTVVAVLALPIPADSLLGISHALEAAYGKGLLLTGDNTRLIIQRPDEEET